MYALRFGSTSVVVVIRILALSYCASADYGCDVTSFTVDCFKRGLREVPIAIIPDEVKSLYLGGNLIENIEVLQTIALKKLEYLDLRDNPVAEIPAGAFRNQTTLKVLCITASSIHPSALEEIPNLTTLVISGDRNLVSLPETLVNSMAHQNLFKLEIQNTGLQTIPDKLISGFKMLQILDFSGNFLREAPRFENTANLRELKLKRNFIVRIEFDYVTNITMLDLSFNQLKQLPKNVSHYLPSLTCLDLTSNQLRHSFSLHGLTQLETLILRENFLSFLEYDRLSRLQSFNLKELDLSHNPWVNLSTHELGYFKKLYILKLQNVSSVNLDLSQFNHNLDTLDLSLNCALRGYKLPVKVRIEYLNFSHSCLKTFAAREKNQGVITRTDIQYNELERLDLAASMKTLNASHNNIKVVNITSTWAEIDTLDVGHNNIERTEDVYISGKVIVKNLNFTFNRLFNITQFYVVPYAAQKLWSLFPIKLDFSFNRISSVSARTLLGIPSLAMLKLNNNNLSTLPNGLFANQVHVKKLDVNYNHLTGISQGIFSNLPYLKFLLIANNLVEDLHEIDFNRSKYLNSLDISDNPFTSLPRDFLPGNQKLKRLRLRATSLPCTCSLMNVLNDTIRENTRLKIDGDCYDSSKQDRQNLKALMKITEANRWVCSKGCATLQCNLKDNCSFYDGRLPMNCSCANSINGGWEFEKNKTRLDNDTWEIEPNLYRQYVSGNPSCLQKQTMLVNRSLVFCIDQNCQRMLRKTIATTTNKDGSCFWQCNSSDNGSSLLPEFYLNCINVPQLVQTFCKIPPTVVPTTTVRLETNGNIGLSTTIKSLIGLAVSVAVISAVVLVVYRLKRWKSTNQVATDMFGLTDFDFLDDVSAETLVDNGA